MNKFIKKQNGSALLLTVLIMSSILVVALLAADLVISGIQMSRTQSQSTKAYFAAEAGVERVLEAKKNASLDVGACVSGQCIQFGTPNQCLDCSNVNKKELANGASYLVYYDMSDGVSSFFSIGDYFSVKRGVKVAFECVPYCANKVCGADDGCGDYCGDRCATGPKCRGVGDDNTNMEEVVGASCCLGRCYDCIEGTYWDETEGECKYYFKDPVSLTFFGVNEDHKNDIDADIADQAEYNNGQSCIWKVYFDDINEKRYDYDVIVDGFKEATIVGSSCTGGYCAASIDKCGAGYVYDGARKTAYIVESGKSSTGGKTSDWLDNNCTILGEGDDGWDNDCDGEIDEEDAGVYH